LPWRVVFNGPYQVGELFLHVVQVGEQPYRVATLRSADPAVPALVPDLYEPTLLAATAGGLRLRGFERIGEGESAAGVVQEWHCSLP
jgi:hypothetical protein